MKTYRQKLQTYAALTLAGIVNAFGITFFLYPVHLYDSSKICLCGVHLFSGVMADYGCAAGLVLSNWILPLYSIITYAAAIKTVDFIAEGLDKSKSAMIITDKPDKICEALSNEFGNGITILTARGYYSDEKKKMIYFVVNRFQISKVRDIVREFDKSAYVTITDVADVL